MRALWFIDAKKRDLEAGALLKRIGVSEFGPRDIVEKLSLVQAMSVSAAQAVAGGARVLVMDEPTRGMSVRETAEFFERIGFLKRLGLSVIYISHRVEEILKIGDRVAILREGRKIAAIEAKEADWDEIVRLVMGREFPNKYPRRAARASGEALRMGGKDAGELGLRGGEILGVAVRGRARRAGLIRGTYGSDPCGSAKTLLKMMNVNQKAA